MDNSSIAISTASTQPVYHIPVMLTESIDGLNIHPGGLYIDVTFGGGGHSKEILRRLEQAEEGTRNAARGHLYSFDQDADAEQNIPSNDRFTFVRSNFRYLKNWMRYYGVEQIDGLIADLGVSSHHFDDETRGFSFRYEAPLDMRMNKRSGTTAADIVNTYDEKRLADTLYLYGELKNSRKIAADIVRARATKKILTTGDLLTAVREFKSSRVQGVQGVQGVQEFKSSKNAELGEGLEQKPIAIEVSPHEKKDLARLFQALRIEVNHEMDALREMLQAAIDLLKPGGRLSVITYHSLEDRIVKNFIKTGNAEGRRETDFYGKALTPLSPVNKVDTPSAEEQHHNPRSRSAKLRIAEKKQNG